MYFKSRWLAASVCLAGILSHAEFAKAAITTLTSGNNLPVVAQGSTWSIHAIDNGITKVEFDNTTSGSGATFTIGKIIVTLNHTNLDFVGFVLVQNDPAAATPTDDRAGLRVFLEVHDTNGLTTGAWTDYDIRTIDTRPEGVPFNADDEANHLALAHFHATTSTSDPLVLQAPKNNVTELNYALGAAVPVGDKFNADAILIHERYYQGAARQFTIQFAPSVPE